MHSVHDILHEAHNEQELLSIVRVGIKKLLRSGYTLSELGLKVRKKKKRTKKPSLASALTGVVGGKKKKKKKDEFDMFELPDVMLKPIHDEEPAEDHQVMVYDEDDDDDDDD